MLVDSPLTTVGNTGVRRCRPLRKPSILRAAFLSISLLMSGAGRSLWADDVAAPVSISVVSAPSATLIDFLQLDPFYQKSVSVGPLSIVSSEVVADSALLEAAWLIQQMIGHRPDVLEAMVAGKTRFSVMAASEFTTSIPEHSDLRPPDYWDRRARGLGATAKRPAVSCGEENLLKYKGDPYAAENILIHEFGHAIHEMGLNQIDGEFDAQLRAAYESALELGLWKGTYAASNHREYWAEGVQSWFDTNRQDDTQHNHVDTRGEIKEYDPRLANLLASVFGDSSWRYTPPAARMQLPHLSTYDPDSAPTFAWPQDLVRRYEAFQLAVQGESSNDEGRWADVQPHELASLEKLRSQRSRESATVLFVNRRDSDIRIEWIDEAGARKGYGRVSAGDYRLIDTYRGHAWLVTTPDGAPLLAFAADGTLNRALLTD